MQMIERKRRNNLLIDMLHVFTVDNPKMKNAVDDVFNELGISLDRKNAANNGNNSNNNNNSGGSGGGGGFDESRQGQENSRPNSMQGRPNSRGNVQLPPIRS
jgi:hypothetical protein